MKMLGSLLSLCCAAACAANPVSITESAPCSNDPSVPPTFRLVTQSGDTLLRVTNHFWTPTHMADTILTRLDDGRIARMIFSYGATHCITALDSAFRHTAGAVSLVP